MQNITDGSVKVKAEMGESSDWRKIKVEAETSQPRERKADDIPHDAFEEAVTALSNAIRLSIEGVVEAEKNLGDESSPTCSQDKTRRRQSKVFCNSFEKGCRGADPLDKYAHQESKLGITWGTLDKNLQRFQRSDRSALDSLEDIAQCALTTLAEPARKPRSMPGNATIHGLGEPSVLDRLRGSADSLLQRLLHPAVGELPKS